MLSNNPSVSFADSSPYTGEPTAAAGLLNGKSLYGTTRLAGGFREPIKMETSEFSFVSICFMSLLYYFYCISVTTKRNIAKLICT